MPVTIRDGGENDQQMNPDDERAEDDADPSMHATPDCRVLASLAQTDNAANERRNAQKETEDRDQ